METGKVINKISNRLRRRSKKIQESIGISGAKGNILNYILKLFIFLLFFSLTIIKIMFIFFRILKFLTHLQKFAVQKKLL